MDMESNFETQQPKKSRGPWLWIALAAVPILIIIGVLTFWLTRSDADSESTHSLQDSSVTESVQIALDDQSIAPATVTVEKGQTVTWLNRGSTPRQITADTNQLPGLDSVRPLAQDESFSYTFEKEGTFSYYDAQNPAEYNGTVIVQ